MYIMEYLTRGLFALFDSLFYAFAKNGWFYCNKYIDPFYRMTKGETLTLTNRNTIQSIKLIW